MPNRFTAAVATTIAMLSLVGLDLSCVTITRQDAFPVPGKRFSLGALRALAGPGSDVRQLPVVAGGRPVAAYYVRHTDARGLVLFCGGSGNQVDAAVKVLSPRTAALGLDLVVFSYYQDGEPVPSVGDVRADAHAVLAAARAVGGPAARAVYVVGHSAGCWFALDLAAGDGVRGLALAGAETTPADVIRRTYWPWSTLVSIRPDDDAKQLDAARYAPDVRKPTLVLTSRQDEEVPAAVGERVLDLLPAGTPKRLVVLDGVTHGRYFLSDAVWREIGDRFSPGPAGDAAAPATRPGPAE